VCTSKTQDRCVNRSQTTRMASASHLRRAKHVATTTTTETETTQPTT
jgi:hypothetical protein